MALTNAGLDHMAKAMLGEAGLTAFNNANARIAVGSGTTAYAATQTALVTELSRQPMESGYPTAYSGGRQSQFRSVFADGVANGAWNEWGILNAGTAGTLLNRVAGSGLLGTKAAGQVWTVTATLTFSVGA